MSENAFKKRLTLITGSCEWETWTRHADKHRRGGRSDSSSTLDTCKSQCVDNTECNGIDWAMQSSTKCWLHGPWSDKTMYTLSGVDYHNLTRNTDCPGK